MKSKEVSPREELRHLIDFVAQRQFLILCLFCTSGPLKDQIKLLEEQYKADKQGTRHSCCCCCCCCCDCCDYDCGCDCCYRCHLISGSCGAKKKHKNYEDLN